jgi:hypothetical protein
MHTIHYAHYTHALYNLWLQYEDRTDDITMIALFFDHIADAKPPAAPPIMALGVTTVASAALASANRKYSRKISAAELHSNPMEAIVKQRKNSQMRPVGSGGERRRRRVKQIMRKNEAEVAKDLEAEETYNVADHIVKKSAEELTRLEVTTKANFLFHHLDSAQRKHLFSVMEKVKDCTAPCTHTPYTIHHTP